MAKRMGNYTGRRSVSPYYYAAQEMIKAMPVGGPSERRHVDVPEAEAHALGRQIWGVSRVLKKQEHVRFAIRQGPPVGGMVRITYWLVRWRTPGQ